MKKTLFYTLSILLFSCGNNSAPQKSSLSGNISDLPEGSQIYLDYLTPTQIFTRDTAIIDENGNYSFNYPIDNLGYYRLRINNQNFINLILDVGQKPIINGNGANLMDTYTIVGSPESDKLKEFNLAIKTDYLLQDSLAKVYQANSNDAQLFIEIQKISLMSEEKLRLYYIDIIDKNPGTLLSLAAVQQLDPKVYAEQFIKVDEALSKTMSNSPYYLNLHKSVEKLKKLVVGGEAPDIILNNEDGNPTSLQALRGNVVLIDFWASWCRPCRAENPNVVKAYKKYHSKGFEVFSVSLDGLPQQQNPKQDWLAAIEKDGLIWKNHVSDLAGWNSSVVNLYGFQGIPFTVLIDREGKIIAKEIRGQELEQKLIELFN